MYTVSKRDADQLTIICSLTSQTAALYAAAMIAKQQGFETRVIDEDPDQLPYVYRGVQDWQIAQLLQRDTVARLKEARDRLTFALTEIETITKEADRLRSTVPSIADRLTQCAHDLATATITAPAFSRSCQEIAADSPAYAWYDDPYTDAMNDHVSAHEGEPEPDYLPTDRFIFVAD